MRRICIIFLFPLLLPLFPLSLLPPQSCSIFSFIKLPFWMKKKKIRMPCRYVTFRSYVLVKGGNNTFVSSSFFSFASSLFSFVKQPFEKKKSVTLSRCHTLNIPTCEEEEICIRFLFPLFASPTPRFKWLFIHRYKVVCKDK